MSRGDRYGNFAPYILTVIGLSVVCVTAWMVSHSKGYQRANEVYESEKAAYSTQYDLQRQCLSLSTSVQIKECFSRQEAPSREHERAEQDLSAQREMADWAEKMLWASLLGTLVTGVGVVYVALTLGEARATTTAALKAADEAEKATVAAQESVSVTRDIGVAQTRAYVQFYDVDAHLEGDCVRLFMRWRNTGQSPAVRAAFGTNYRTVDGDDDEVIDFTIDLSTDSIPIIGSGHASRDVSIHIPSHVADGLKAGTSKIFLWGAIEYNDVFPNTPRRRTEFCIVISKVSPKKGKAPDCDIETHGDHNGADDGCMFTPST